jgi:hypothetical protein
VSREHDHLWLSQPHPVAEHFHQSHSVHLRHPEVEQDHRRRVIHDHAHGDLAVVRLSHRVAVRFQSRSQHQADAGLVVGDENDRTVAGHA